MMRYALALDVDVYDTNQQLIGYDSLCVLLFFCFRANICEKVPLAEFVFIFNLDG